VDCLAAALWRTQPEAKGAWPERTFEELRKQVSGMQGYDVAGSTVRSAVYQRGDLFERTRKADGSLRWRLSRKARTRVGPEGRL
jgi:hypothetical protein